MRLMDFFFILTDQVSNLILTCLRGSGSDCALLFSLVPADLPESGSRRAAGGEWSDGTGPAVWDQRVHRRSDGGQRFFWGQGTISVNLHEHLLGTKSTSYTKLCYSKLNWHRNLRCNAPTTIGPNLKKQRKTTKGENSSCSREKHGNAVFSPET